MSSAGIAAFSGNPIAHHDLLQCKKTVFQALEDRFECWLLNAHHLRIVPGGKTDVKDSGWICQLVRHGLVRRASCRRRRSAGYVT